MTAQYPIIRINVNLFMNIHISDFISYQIDKCLVYYHLPSSPHDKITKICYNTSFKISASHPLGRRRKLWICVLSPNFSNGAASSMSFCFSSPPLWLSRHLILFILRRGISSMCRGRPLMVPCMLSWGCIRF